MLVPVRSQAELMNRSRCLGRTRPAPSALSPSDAAGDVRPRGAGGRRRTPHHHVPRLFASDGQPIEVHVTWWSETLWFVPYLRDAETMWREGIARERLWTASELSAIIEGGRWTGEAHRMVTIVRQEFEGEVVAARGPHTQT
jgi:hypothetical protein